MSQEHLSEMAGVLFMRTNRKGWCFMAKPIYVNGVQIKTPSSATYGLQDVSDSASGRTQDTIMHKNRIGQKVKWSYEWWGTNDSETASLLQTFNNEYIMLTYHDPMYNKYVTKEFYVGDRSAPVKTYALGNTIYERISFDVIER